MIRFDHRSTSFGFQSDANDAILLKIKISNSKECALPDNSLAEVLKREIDREPFQSLPDRLLYVLINIPLNKNDVF